MATKRMTDLVHEYLQPLLDQYQFSFHQYWPYGGVGDMVEYRSEEYRLRFVNDKSQVMADVGANKADTLGYDLMLVISFISQSRSLPDFSGSVEQQVERLSNLLSDYATRIFTHDLLVNQAQELSAYAKEWIVPYPWELKK